MVDNHFDAENRASYRYWSREILRYADLDPVGHVNNNAYGLYIENARTKLFHSAEYAVLSAGGSVGYDWVLRRLEIDYLREVRFPGEVETGLICSRMGNSSMILHVGVFDAEYCAAISTGVSVCFDVSARAAMRIPDDMRQAIWDCAGGG